MTHITSIIFDVGNVLIGWDPRRLFAEHFPTLEAVPTQAISMSIRQIMKSAAIVCTVPDLRKAQAVKSTVEGPVTNLVPASIMQRHPHAVLLLDELAASLLGRR